MTNEHPLPSLDAIRPQEVALKAEQLGVDKVANPRLRVLALSVLAVTLGNIVGRSGLVVALYWFIYQRGRKAAEWRVGSTSPV